MYSMEFISSRNPPYRVDPISIMKLLFHSSFLEMGVFVKLWSYVF
jgi:hypothetical protein